MTNQYQSIIDTAQLERETDKLYKSLLPWFENTRYWPPMAGDFVWLVCWLEMAGNLDVVFKDTFNHLPLSEFTNETNKRIFSPITHESFRFNSVLFQPGYESLDWAKSWQWMHQYCLMFSGLYPNRHISSHGIYHWIAFHNNRGGFEGSYTNYVKLPSWSKHLPTDFNALVSGMPTTTQQAYFMDFA